MKIVHLIFSLKTGGAETMLVDLLNEQANLGHDVTLVVINDCYDDSVLSKVNVSVTTKFFNRKPASRNPLIIIRLNYFLWLLKPDAIHLHNEHISKLLLTKSSCYLTVHALNISLSTSCKKLKELFAISDAVKEDVEKRYPGKYLVTTIPNGICVNDIVRKQTYQLNDQRMRVVQVANLLPAIKGQDILIKAVGLLNKRGFQHIYVDFIGGCSADSLQQLSKENNVEDRIRFVGLRNRNYIYAHLKDYDLMCHPSRHEGFGLTVAEGIAAGLPVLVPDADGPYEIIQYGKLGFVFKKGNVESLADTLQDLYEHYVERAVSVVDAAYEYVKAHYSIHHMVEQYIEEYKKYKK